MILTIVCKKIKHPQTNGQVKSANRVLLKGGSSNFLGLSHYSLVNNQGDALQFGIWFGCHDTSRDPRKHASM